MSPSPSSLKPSSRSSVVSPVHRPRGARRGPAPARSPVSATLRDSVRRAGPQAPGARQPATLPHGVEREQSSQKAPCDRTITYGTLRDGSLHFSLPESSRSPRKKKHQSPPGVGSRGIHDAGTHALVRNGKAFAPTNARKHKTYNSLDTRNERLPGQRTQSHRPSCAQLVSLQAKAQVLHMSTPRSS